MQKGIISIERESLPTHARAQCGSCKFEMFAHALPAVDGTELTPGAEVPAGLCPKCHALAYLIPRRALPATPSTVQAKSLPEHVEALIDTYGLPNVIGAAGEIAAEKAEHIRANWSDSKALAINWQRASGYLATLYARVRNLQGVL